MAVLVGLLMPILIGFAGFSADIGHWYLTGNREQKAADAAALAGAIYLPNDPAKAFSVARDVARENGYRDDGETLVTIVQETNPVQLRVTIRQEVSNYFTPLFGIPTTTITRTGVGEFQGPVPMGSPVNTFGNEPLGAGEPKWSTNSGQPQFWGVIAGPAVAKVQGDAIQSKPCTSSDDGCVGGVNTDYNTSGYFYSVTVPPGGAGKRLQIEVFDPVFAEVGNTCTSNLGGATSSRNDYVSDESERYRSGNGTFCTGDTFYGGSTNPTTTSFVVRAPSSTSWDPLSAPVIRDGANCQPTQYRGYEGALASRLNGPTSDPVNDHLQRNFRRWSRLCTIPNAEEGDYIIQVRTNVAWGSDAAGPGNTSVGDGQNRFALRAGFVNTAGAPSGSQAGVRIAGISAMAMYANASGATTEFHMARVMSGSEGRTLVIDIFDPSDAAGTGTLRILPPSDSGLSTFPGCTGAGPVTGSLSNCTVPTNNRDFQGKWQTIRVPIPAGYRCNDTDPNGCWIKIRYSFAGGTSVTDTTTWRATMEGDPVRLVE
ncbi:MAG: pilus assembly protein TadG-related protein [Acidimicrobiia bacterium]